MTENVLPAYLVETERLRVRAWSPADAPRLGEAITASLPELLPWMPWAWAEPEPLDAKVARLRSFRAMHDRGDDAFYAVLSKDEAFVLGGTGSHRRAGEGAREVGYWIRSGHTGAGLATEVAAAMTAVAFLWERVSRVDILCARENRASARVAAKLGFRHEATLRRRIEGAGPGAARRDAMVWTLFDDEFDASPAARASASVRAFDELGRRLL